MSEILGGLLLIGIAMTSMMNSKNESMCTQGDNNGNIYDSGKIKENRDAYQQMANDKYTKALCPNKTNVIPDFNFRENCELDDQFKLSTHDNFGAPSEKNANESNSDFSNCKNNMTYGVVPPGAMAHNNMIPSFDAKNSGFSIDNDEHRGNITQRKMDLFTGSLNNLNYRPKTERRPLYSPMIGLTYPYGSPVLPSEYNSRYIPSRERRNEKPFQEVRVTPGLNLGYNDVGKCGFFDVYRAPNKTVDELRTVSNPKKTYTTPTIIQLKGDRRPIDPVVKKYSPWTFDIWGTKRMLPQYNPDLSKQRARDKYDPKNLATVNRGLTKRVYNKPVAFANKLSTPESLYSKSRTPLRENFPDNHVGPVSYDTRGQTTYDMITNIPDPNMRNLHNNCISGFVGGDRQSYTHDRDIPDPNMRNLHNKGVNGFISGDCQSYIHDRDIPDPNMRNLHNKGINGFVSGDRQSYTHDRDIPDPNMRNLHNKGVNGFLSGDRQGYAHDRDTPDPNMRNLHNKGLNGFVGGDLQSYAPDHDIPDPNMRNLHNKGINGFVGGDCQSYAYDRDTPDPNMRNLHNKGTNGFVGGDLRSYTHDHDTPDPNMRNLHNKSINGAVSGNPQSYANDHDIPDPTMRDMHNKTNISGAVGIGQMDKYTFDAKNNVPDPTMRNIHNAKRNGFIGNSVNNKSVAFDKNNSVPEPTMRDIHQQTGRAGIIGSSFTDKTFIFDMTSNIPDPTFREIHINNDYVRPSGPGNSEHQQSRADANNMYVNIGKEDILVNRMPTKSNYTKCPEINGTMMQLCDKIQINRDLYPDIKQQVTQKMPTMYTVLPDRVPNDGCRFLMK